MAASIDFTNTGFFLGVKVLGENGATESNGVPAGNHGYAGFSPPAIAFLRVCSVASCLP
jgi:hypothetical protein